MCFLFLLHSVVRNLIHFFVHVSLINIVLFYRFNNILVLLFTTWNIFFIRNWKLNFVFLLTTLRVVVSLEAIVFILFFTLYLSVSLSLTVQKNCTNVDSVIENWLNSNAYRKSTHIRYSFVRNWNTSIFVCDIRKINQTGHGTEQDTGHFFSYNRTSGVISQRGILTCMCMDSLANVAFILVDKLNEVLKVFHTIIGIK